MHIVLESAPIRDERYQDLLSSVSKRVFNLYVMIFNRVRHTNVKYNKNKLSQGRNQFYKDLRQLESLGLISITLEDKGQ